MRRDDRPLLACSRSCQPSPTSLSGLLTRVRAAAQRGGQRRPRTPVHGLPAAPRYRRCHMSRAGHGRAPRERFHAFGTDEPSAGERQQGPSPACSDAARGLARPEMQRSGALVSADSVGCHPRSALLFEHMAHRHGTSASASGRGAARHEPQHSIGGPDDIAGSAAQRQTVPYRRRRFAIWCAADRNVTVRPLDSFGRARR